MSDHLIPKWRPYLYDAAFQKYVVKNAYPDFQVSTYLFLIDKTQPASVDGLNQKRAQGTMDRRDAGSLAKF
jgi:hypothetical protein